MSIDYLADLVINLSPGWLYLALFLGAIFESYFPPYPSDIVTLYCSFLVGKGKLCPISVYLIAVSGSYIGIMTLYYLAMIKGREFFLKRNVPFFPTEKIKGIENWFGKYGDSFVIASRFLPAIRAFIAPAAGIAKMNTYKMGIYSFISISLWNAFLFGIGSVIGLHWERAKAFLKAYNFYGMIIIVFIIIAWFVLSTYRKRKQNSISIED